MKTAVPAASSPSRSRSKERRQLLLDTTLRLVAAGGVDSVTHRRVASAAGVPLGSTTYYFDSREHLLREAFRHYLEQARSAHSALAEGFQERGAEGVVDFLVELTHRQFADANMLRAEYELTLFASRDAEVAEQLHAWGDWMVAQLARALEALGTARSFDAARTLVDLMRGYELDRLTRDELDSDGLRRRLETVLAGFLPDERATAAT